MAETREESAASILGWWHSLYPGDGLCVVYGATPLEPDVLGDVSVALGPFLGNRPTLAAMSDFEHDTRVRFETFQRRYPLRPESGLLPDPARAAIEQGIMEGDEGAADKVGAWRWPLLQKHADQLLPLIRDCRCIDLGGAAAR